MKTAKQGWIGLQRRQGAEFLRWLEESRALEAGFDALASSLHALLERRVQKKEDALKVWAAVPSVMDQCDDPNTLTKPEAASAYSWLHLPDRYVRTWLTLQELVNHCLLPMGKEGVRALDVGTGPGPSAFATHDFYAAMTEFAEVSSNELWCQPARMTCVELSESMNTFRHHLAELMAERGASHSVIAYVQKHRQVRVDPADQGTKGVEPLIALGGRLLLRRGQRAVGVGTTLHAGRCQ